MRLGHSRVHWAVFGLCSLIGLVSAALLFAFLAVSECLPRDGSVSMLACDAEKKREFWLYPLLFAVSLAAATWLERKGRLRGKLLAATAGIVAMCMLLLIERL